MLSRVSTVYSCYILDSLQLLTRIFAIDRLWKVFYDDKERPGRYLLAKELISRPDAEELEVSFRLSL